RGALRDQLFQSRLIFSVLFNQFPVFKCALYAQFDFIELEGLNYIIVGAKTQGIDGTPSIVQRGHKDYHRLDTLLTRVAQDVQASHARHLNVAQHYVKLSFFQRFQSLCSITRHIALITAHTKEFQQEKPYSFLIIYNEDMLFWVTNCHFRKPSGIAFGKSGISLKQI